MFETWVEGRGNFNFASMSFVSVLASITYPCCLVTDQIEAVLWTAVLTLLSVEWRRTQSTSPCYEITGLTLLPTSNAGWTVMMWRTNWNFFFIKVFKSLWFFFQNSATALLALFRIRIDNDIITHFFIKKCRLFL